MTCHGCHRSSVVRSVDSASLLGLGCVGGIVLGLGVLVVLMLYSVGELRQMIGRWFMALVNRK